MKTIRSNEDLCEIQFDVRFNQKKNIKISNLVAKFNIYQ